MNTRLLIAQLPFSTIIQGGTQTHNGTAHSGLGFMTSFKSIQTIPHRHAHSLPQVILHVVKLTSKTNHQYVI